MFKSFFRKKRAGYRIALSLTVLALITAACSSSPAGSGNSGGASGAAGELSIVASPTGPFTNGFNPFSLSTSAYVQGATGLIYEPLMQFNLVRWARSTHGSRSPGRGPRVARNSSCTPVLA